MRSGAWILLVLGTLLGVLGGSKLPRVDWLLTGGGLALMGLGGGLLRRRAQTLYAQAERVSEDPSGPLREVLILHLARARQLSEEAPSLPFAGLRDRLEGELLDLGSFLETSCTSLLRPLGAARYAAVFGSFASGERWLRRAWSAAVDNHRQETVAALQVAILRLEAALEAASSPDRRKAEISDKGCP